MRSEDTERTRTQDAAAQTGLRHTLSMVKRSPPRISEGRRNEKEPAASGSSESPKSEDNIGEDSVMIEGEQYQPQQGKMRADAKNSGSERVDRSPEQRPPLPERISSSQQSRRQIWNLKKGRRRFLEDDPVTFRTVQFRINFGRIMQMDVNMDDSVFNIKMRVLYQAQFSTSEHTIELAKVVSGYVFKSI